MMLAQYTFATITGFREHPGSPRSACRPGSPHVGEAGEARHGYVRFMAPPPAESVEPMVKAGLA